LYSGKHRRFEGGGGEALKSGKKKQVFLEEGRRRGVAYDDHKRNPVRGAEKCGGGAGWVPNGRVFLLSIRERRGGTRSRWIRSERG